MYEILSIWSQDIKPCEKNDAYLKRSQPRSSHYQSNFKAYTYFGKILSICSQDIEQKTYDRRTEWWNNECQTQIQYFEVGLYHKICFGIDNDKGR